MIQKSVIKVTPEVLLLRVSSEVPLLRHTLRKKAMPFVSILSPLNRKAFETPPVLSDEERAVFFEPGQWGLKLIRTFRSSTNKVGFVLLLGYFRVTNRFFQPKQFHQHDVEYVISTICMEKVYLEKYSATTLERHKTIILNQLGFRKFNFETRLLLEKEAAALSERQMRPRSLFLSLVDFLRSKKIEVPGYYALSEIITNALQNVEKKLHDKIECQLTVEQQQFLDKLLEVNEEYLHGEKQELKLKRYTITLLKKSNQSTRPSKIKKNIEILKYLKELFDKLRKTIQALEMTPEAIQYYARIALKTQVFQLQRREKNKYVYLIAFIVHQYYWMNDLLIDILLHSLQTSKNTVFRQHKEEVFRTKNSNYNKMKSLSQRMGEQLSKLKEIERIIHLPEENMSDNEKIEAVKELLKRKEEREQLEQQLETLEKETERVLKNHDYYDLLEARSLKLQNRISPILKNIDFDIDCSDKALTKSISDFKDKHGNVGSATPSDFLDSGQRKILFNSNGKWRPSLYKVFLFQYVGDAIKSGTLNLKHSYKYRSFEDYLLSQKQWQSEKHELLERAGLTEFENFSKLEPELKAAIEAQFHKTNQNIRLGQNKYAKFRTNGKLIVSTPKKEKPLVDSLAFLFPKNRIVSLFEILSAVNQVTGFTEALEHHQLKNIRKKQKSSVLFAGIIGLGCNHGVQRITKISRNINPTELEHAVNWYFTPENLVRANDKILELLDCLSLPKLYKNSIEQTHTSSDGQKYHIHVESLNANFSYKYFGSGKGVTVYVFLDDTHRLFYSTVINSAESEAVYVIDGLMHNEIVQSDLHSTDTAGYSEIVFGACHLLGISFAPRIKNFKKQQLYSFEKRLVLKELGYTILPSERINNRLIAQNWDEILRFITTIKLRHTSASQLFRRLSSYSRQHPLYKALKEFGKIIKTLFLLNYIDDLELRQNVRKQLNKLESSNKFGKAVFHGNNQEFRLATKEEQILVESCKRLIENAIICWNYLYLSQITHDTNSEQEKAKIIEIIKNGSVVTWQHINMQGEYDFSEECLQNAITFRINELIGVKF